MAVWPAQSHSVKEIGRVRLDQKLLQDDIVGGGSRRDAWEPGDVGWEVGG